MRHYSEMIEHIREREIPTVKDRNGVEYLNIEAGFDIETTSHKAVQRKTAFMYVWMIAIEYQDDVFSGRTWGEFVELCEQLQELYGLGEKKRLVVYVHNLGYEFQFMRKYFEWMEVFSANTKKPINALCSLGIEFRDSYILSGYSLSNTAKNLTTHDIKKLEGDLDYDLVRHHETPLTDDEVNYCVNDVQIILAYINEQIGQCGDVSKIPMTNTGRVRKYVRGACMYRNAKGKRAGQGQRVRYQKIMQDLTLTTETYDLLRTAFMGGFTHANINHVGEVIEDVTSIDFTSSYPSVMLSEKFPMSEFYDYEVNSVGELEALMDKFAVVAEVRFNNIRSKIDQDDYLSESKCRRLSNQVVNNGRIVSADALEVTITDVDYSLMSQCYEWDDIQVGLVKYAHLGYLPKAICNSLLSLYQDKTKLKGVDGSEAEYMLSKGMLNSVYGMCVTDVVKKQSIYDDDGEWIDEMPIVDDVIDKYNKSRNRFLFYAWGVWITAYARKNLWSGILAVGDDYIYSDTDSIKLVNYSEHGEYIEWFNTQITTKMELMCDFHKLDKTLLAPKTNEGIEKKLGVWDYEGTYSKFKTLGAKRYLYENDNGFNVNIEDAEELDMQITVAGLSKQDGLNYILAQCDNDSDAVFEMFNDELHIPEEYTGKMTHTFIDSPHTLNVEDYTGKKVEVTTLSGLHLEKCSFTLSVSENIREHLRMVSNGYQYTGADFI